ncbi:hypothetical protein KC335_g166 [Hortaea werneckii]|nr:hypothetical protein KC335_g166 [Hortaea werneckii]
MLCPSPSVRALLLYSSRCTAADNGPQDVRRGDKQCVPSVGGGIPKQHDVVGLGFRAQRRRSMERGNSEREVWTLLACMLRMMEWLCMLSSKMIYVRASLAFDSILQSSGTSFSFAPVALFGVLLVNAVANSGA